jgi:hypothetical protein
MTTSPNAVALLKTGTRRAAFPCAFSGSCLRLVTVRTTYAGTGTVRHCGGRGLAY